MHLPLEGLPPHDLVPAHVFLGQTASAWCLNSVIIASLWSRVLFILLPINNPCWPLQGRQQ